MRFEMDLDKELDNITSGRFGNERPKRRVVKEEKRQVNKERTHDKNIKQDTHKVGGGSNDQTEQQVTQEVKHVREDQGFGHNTEHPAPIQEQKVTPLQNRMNHSVDWSNFLELSGVFKYVGGDRPVVIDDSKASSTVTPLSRGIMMNAQKRLKERFLGAKVKFPWGVYEIKNNNKVFVYNTTLIRYLLFESLYDGDNPYLNVQYAKQWLLLHHEDIMDEHFDVLNGPHLQSDNLDIYALIYVSYIEKMRERESNKQELDSIQNSVLMAKLNSIEKGVSYNVGLLRKHVSDEQQNSRFSEFMHVLTYMERMALIKDPLPRDVGGLIAMLERNRDVINETWHRLKVHDNAEIDRMNRINNNQ